MVIMFSKRFLAPIVYAILLALTGCQLSSSCESFQWNRAIEVPAFLGRVWPVPGEQLSEHCYTNSLSFDYNNGRGIGAIFLTAGIDLDLLSPPASSIDQRIQLFVDDQLVPKDDAVIIEHLTELIEKDEAGNVIHTGRSGSYYLAWTPLLEVGVHEARFEVIRDNGELLTFSWGFTITK